jgi:DNA-nicking Smr family endonuclease
MSRSADAGHNGFLDAEDTALWAHVAAQTRPLLKKAAVKSSKPKSPAASRKTKKPEAILLPTVQPAIGTVPTPLMSPSPMSPSHREKLAHGDERDLRRGSVRIDGRIDLHGMTREEAHRAVRRYLTEAVEQARRIVLVITGKGGRNDSGGGVLRSELPRWLHEGSLARIVLAWRPAVPRHGGDGAFYVLLRKKGRVS